MVISERSSESSSQPIIRLPWDSDHFGINVGRIESLELSDDELSQCLLQARKAQLDLVYWTTMAGRVPAAQLMEQFRGQLVDIKTTYAINVADILELSSQAALPFRIEEHPCGPASSELRSVAVQSGVYSRYRVDSRLPSHVLRTLYETWIERSTWQEIADVVFTAINSDNKHVGLLTLRIAGEESQIGLLGVDGSFRRLGIARMLINACHHWVAERAVRSVSVVTQGNNHAACSFYERCGYRVRDRKNVFHFWPQQPFPPQ